MKTRYTKLVSSCLAFGLVAGVAACGGDEQQPMTPASRVATPVAPAEAVNRISNARCAHEQACNNVGGGEEFQSFDHCMRNMKADASRSLDDCQHGIAENDLQQCLGEISNEDCGGVASVFDNLDTFMQCRSGALCLD